MLTIQRVSLYDFKTFGYTHRRRHHDRGTTPQLVPFYFTRYPGIGGPYWYVDNETGDPIPKGDSFITSEQWIGIPSLESIELGAAADYLTVIVSARVFGIFITFIIRYGLGFVWQITKPSLHHGASANSWHDG